MIAGFSRLRRKSMKCLLFGVSSMNGWYDGNGGQCEMGEEQTLKPSVLFSSDPCAVSEGSKLCQLMLVNVIGNVQSHLNEKPGQKFPRPNSKTLFLTFKVGKGVDHVVRFIFIYVSQGEQE